MKRIVLPLVLVFNFLVANAANQDKYQSTETSDYIQKYYKIAIRHMLTYKIPASITLAQGILESGSGRSTLAVKANNHFGIKCKNDYTGPTYYKSDDKLHECFRKYNSVEESYEDHALFIAKRKPYELLFQYKVTEYKKWAKGLQKCGYATNKQYPDLLISIIEANKLYLYDQNPEKYLKEDDRYDPNKTVIPDNNVKPTPNPTPAPTNRNNPPKVINGKLAGVKCVVVARGNTYYSLSKAYGVSLNNLYKYNEIDASHILQVGEVLFLGAKKSSYKDAAYHYVEAGETAWSISQKYAITVKKLLKMNSLKVESQVRPGMNLKLHK